MPLLDLRHLDTNPDHATEVWRNDDQIVKNLRIADTVLGRLVGLGLIATFPAGTGLLLVPCNSIHTLWPALAIDVVFLSPDQRILRTCPELPHLRLSPIVWGARSVMELPPGTIRRFELSNGQTLEFKRRRPR